MQKQAASGQEQPGAAKRGRESRGAISARICSNGERHVTFTKRFEGPEQVLRTGVREQNPPPLLSEGAVP